MKGTLKENIDQTAAINVTKGPVIIVSCPGSGKTTTLIRRIINLTEHGAAPHRILMVTFTNSAAKDMKARYEALTEKKNDGVQFMTLHSLCNRILLETGACTPGNIYPENARFEFLINSMSYYGAYIDDRAEMAKSLLQEFSAMKNREIPLGEYQPECCEKAFFDSMYQAYEEEKKRSGLYDYDDMIIFAREVLQTRPDILEYYQGQFDYIQCDEYQDTNTIQRDILYMLAYGKHGKYNLCVVGDDDQAIYRFRGTTSRIMQEFKSDFEKKGLDCRMIKMQTNYRSMQKIVDVSAACIGWNKNRIPKSPISDKGLIGQDGKFEYIKTSNAQEEARKALEIIKRRHEEGIPYKDMAILYRVNRQAAAPAQYLSAENIPYKANDRFTCIYDEWMFTDIRAYAEMGMGINVEKNKMRVLNRPTRYFSASVFRGLPFTAEGMLKGIEDKKDSGWQYDAAQKQIFAWLNCFGSGKLSGDDPPSKLFEKLKGKGSVHYDKYIRERAKFRNADEEELLSDFEELRKEAGRFPTIREWFSHAERLSAAVKSDSSKKDENGVCLSTIHGAKGLEWNTVILIGVGQKNIPGTKVRDVEDLEEERRILYVGMTRAAEELYVSYYGKESDFMIQTMKKLREMQAPPVPKKFRGAPVSHRKYGRGKIDRYTKDRVTVEFPDYGIKKFEFPGAFQKGYLKYI